MAILIFRVATVVQFESTLQNTAVMRSSGLALLLIAVRDIGKQIGISGKAGRLISFWNRFL
jgi:hypothetical protein